MNKSNGWSVLTDMTGQRFGKLLVLRRASPVGAKPVKWNAVCDCGNTTTVAGTKLRSGHTKSCGCFRVEFSAQKERTHGMSNTATYRAWAAMWRRCTNMRAVNYKWYGGRGIKVCDRWWTFEAFLEDMGIKPEGMELDRIDVNGDYSPENCRWVTHQQNCQNRRSSGARI